MPQPLEAELSQHRAMPIGAGAQPQPVEGTSPEQALSPEVVRAVTAKVLALLQRDLAVDRERVGPRRTR